MVVVGGVIPPQDFDGALQSGRGGSLRSGHADSGVRAEDIALVAGVSIADAPSGR